MVAAAVVAVVLRRKQTVGLAVAFFQKVLDCFSASLELPEPCQACSGRRKGNGNYNIIATMISYSW